MTTTSGCSSMPRKAQRRASLNLIKAKIHFAVFYALGQKCPHIIIYDFMQLNELTKIARRKARELFCSNFVPFEYYYQIDKSLFSEHKVCLEFRGHWRYHTIFNLITEWLPQEEKCNN